METKKKETGELPVAGENSKPTVDEEIERINAEIEEYAKTIDVEKLDAALERLYRKSHIGEAKA